MKINGQNFIYYDIYVTFLNTQEQNTNAPTLSTQINILNRMHTVTFWGKTLKNNVNIHLDIQQIWIILEKATFRNPKLSLRQFSYNARDTRKSLAT